MGRPGGRASAKVHDFAEFLAGLFETSGGPVAARHPLPVRAAYHDACHLGHAQQITASPRALLGSIPGLELTEIPDAGMCCGSAGVYNLLQPEAARELGQRKAASVQQTGAPLLISANPGCSLQIAAALEARARTSRSRTPPRSWTRRSGAYRLRDPPSGAYGQSFWSHVTQFLCP